MKLLLIISIMLMGMSIGLWAQDFYEINTINEVRLIFTQSNWDQLLDQYFFAGLEQRLMGTCIINGVTYDSVGVRYKGNSSYNPTRVKNPLNIKLDYVREDQLLDGKYGTVKLSNGFSDPSMVRETLGYEIARKYMPASRANYANVYINNNLIGLYTSVQDVDSEFMREHLHCSGKPRFKCDTNSFSPIPVWGYLGADSTFYTSYYGLESDEGWDTLINFTNVMSNNPAELPYVMNIDQNLWMIAFDNLLANLDSPIQVFHNFYLFGDSDNRINPLLWDLNMCFGGFRQNMTLTSMQNMDPLRYQNSTQFLLISRMLSNPRYKKMYLAHMRTMLTENFSNGWYATRAVELQTICGPSFQADPNKFFSYTNFQNNLNSSVPGSSGGSICGITELMNVRAAYVANHASMSGTVPAIASINCTTPEPVAYSTVSFTMATSNATYAQLGIRQNIKDKFTYHQMYDDGLHEDGAASDGLYGVSVQLGYGDLQYYGWAENASQGVFLPARAEHEFFELPVTLNPGELIINEIQAKNVSTIADPNGEYDDWVEIYNPNNYPVDIAGMYMTDNHYSNGITAWTQIPSVSSLATTIPAHGYLVVWFDEQPTQGPLHINNKLGASADAVYLIDANGTTVIDSKSWTDATGLNADDVSFGRYPDGASTWQLFGAGQTNPCTPGATNLGTVNAAPVISAIQYSPLNTTASTPITISAQVTDEDNNLSTVQLHWGLTNVTENTTTMLLQSGRYSASIGTFNLGSTIRYCIKAVDDLGAQTISRTYNIIIGYQTPTLYINEVMPANT
ncbi:MAG: CotH kinase family protein, partial [Candidatus Cloacimonetes bacterium]|nr:CotH kinase family protein [Candidatus Cloacimonadota bacterium]